MKLTHRIVTGLVAVCLNPALVHLATVQTRDRGQSILGENMIETILKGDPRETIARFFLSERDHPDIEGRVASQDPEDTTVPVVPPRQVLAPFSTISPLHRCRGSKPAAPARQHPGHSRMRTEENLTSPATRVWRRGATGPGRDPLVGTGIGEAGRPSRGGEKPA